MRYGNVALGVECALPLMARRRASRLRRLARWLLATARRWA
jgi:hypothetical protein